MKKTALILALLAAAVITTGCTSMPTHTSQLDQTRSDYLTAQRNPAVAMYAAVEMQQAGVAMEKANAAAADSRSNENIDKLAYLAQQKIALAQEVAKQKAAEASVDSARHERDQVRLESRTNEARQARLDAEQSQIAAQNAQAATADAQMKMEEAQARSAQLETQLAGMSALKTERGMVITLGDVLYGTDLTRLTADGMRTVQKLADVLEKNPQRTVLIEGFTDSSGSAEHNQDLSERRAAAVRTALIDLGVPQDRVAVHGYGQSYPVAANDAAHMQLNRRVEIIVSDASGKIAQR